MKRGLRPSVNTTPLVLATEGGDGPVTSSDVSTGTDDNVAEDFLGDGDGGILGLGAAVTAGRKKDSSCYKVRSLIGMTNPSDKNTTKTNPSD